MFNVNSHRSALVSQVFTKTKKQTSFESHQYKRLTFQTGPKFRIFYIQTVLAFVWCPKQCIQCLFHSQKKTRTFAHKRAADFKPLGCHHTVGYYKLESENNCAVIFAKVDGSQGQMESYYFWSRVDSGCYGKRKNTETPIFFFLYLLHPSWLH